VNDVKYRYIQNTHNAPITCHIKDVSGKIITTKKFMPALTEKFSGKVLHTGYERLTEEEYKVLCETSKTFQVYSGMTGKVKLLVAHDDLPAEAKSPHEALVDARKDARVAAAKIAELNNQIVALKAELLDAQNRYKELSSASTDDEKLKPLNDRIAVLETEKAALQKAVDEQRPSEDKTIELTGELERLGASVDELFSALSELRNKHVDKVLEAYRAAVRGKITNLEESKDSE